MKSFPIILSSILLFPMLYLPSFFQIGAAAQTGVLTHKDITNGFSVSYPASWVKQDNVYGTHGVQFSPNPTTRDNVLIDVTQQPGTDLDSWTQEKIDSISSRPGATILLLNPTTLGGNPAYKVEYTWEGDKILEIWTLIGDKLYAISYVGEGEERYRQNLPVAQSIIDSFQVTDEVSPQEGTGPSASASAPEPQAQAQTSEPTEESESQPEPEIVNCFQGWHQDASGTCQPDDPSNPTMPSCDLNPSQPRCETEGSGGDSGDDGDEGDSGDDGDEDEDQEAEEEE